MGRQFSGAYRYWQRETLIENISDYIKTLGSKSLLDIGAGSEDMALALASRVEAYTAVEQDPVRAASLRRVGLRVIEATFPARVEGAYDMVLSSHSLPETRTADYEDFLTKAWRKVAPGGHFLVATFKGGRGAPEEIHDAILGGSPEPGAQFTEMMRILGSLGSVSIERVNSYATTSVINDIVSFIEDWTCTSPLSETLKEEVRRIVRRLYRIGDCFVLPTEHLFITCRKSPTAPDGV